MKYRNVVILSLFHPVKAQDSHVYWAYHFSVTAMRTAQFDDIYPYVASDWVLHDPQFGNIKGIDGYVYWVSWWHTLLPDLEFVVNQRVDIDDMVVITWTISGTHTGEMKDIPASGNQVRIRGILIHHIVDNKLVESWVTFNDQWLRLQLGLIDTLMAECERSVGVGCD